MKYRIKTVKNNFGSIEYWVEKQRPKFFFFGPMVWVDAITWDDCPYWVPYFNSYEKAEMWINEQIYGPEVSYSKEYEVK